MSILRCFWQKIKRWLCGEDENPTPALKFASVSIDNVIVRGAIMAVSMRVDQSVVLSVAFTDRRGNPTDGVDPVSWSGGGTLTPSEDGMSCTVVPAAVGDFQVTAQSGTLSATMDISATASLPVSLTVTAADPVDLP